MINMHSTVKVYLCTSPTDMRKGFDTLSALVQETLKRDPFSGHWFVFRNRNGDRVKVISWDGSGLVLYYKRIDSGHFIWPKTEGGVLTMTASELSVLLEGLDWRRIPIVERKKPTKAA